MARIEFLRHKKVNAAADDGVSEVQPQHWNLNAHNQTGILGFDDEIKALVTGAFVVSGTLQNLAAESGTADDVVTLTTTDIQVNDLAIITPDTGDTITVKNTGNISLPGGIDIVLADTQYLLLIFNGTKWVLPNVIGNALVDDNGNEILIFEKTASAVNEITIKNAATGNSPEIKASGGDADIDVKIVPKGTGKIDADGFDLLMGTGILQFVDANQSIQNIAGNLIYDVATGQVHIFRVNDVAEMQLSATALDLKSNALLTTGAVRITGGTMRIPLLATPIMAVDGDFAIDTTITDFSMGLIKYFDGEEMAVVAMPIAQLTTPADGEAVTYNATTDEFELRAAGGGGLTFAKIVKSADETVTNSSVMQNDDELVFTPTISKTYSFKLVLFWNASLTADIKIAFTVPSGCTIVWTNIEVISGAGEPTSDATTPHNIPSGNDDRVAIVYGRIIMDTTAGNVQFQWAQNTSDGQGTIVRKGSTLLAYEEGNT